MSGSGNLPAPGAAEKILAEEEEAEENKAEAIACSEVNERLWTQGLETVVGSTAAAITIAITTATAAAAATTAVAAPAPASAIAIAAAAAPAPALARPVA
ncbi:uncharacterized protein Triagg1_2704 [Trichoderma aggressivum f. europaeum]|uniref:Uncharacterized protein n=1 Tax=Trichoderma aggressivum f. europaeum TaxID=173218 RepID=A0AAE1IHI7_9HYPO|nr:hypothetical protein Triagg1_2704 [Trichoderma aggressivum f. europaeum]